jgi:hypothetical protein
MDDRKMQIIQELMDQLQDEMKYSPDDLGERLGRKKPELEVVKMEGELPMDDEMSGDDKMSDLGSDDDMMM